MHGRDSLSGSKVKRIEETPGCNEHHLYVHARYASQAPCRPAPQLRRHRTVAVARGHCGLTPRARFKPHHHRCVRTVQRKRPTSQQLWTLRVACVGADSIEPLVIQYIPAQDARACLAGVHMKRSSFCTTPPCIMTFAQMTMFSSISRTCQSRAGQMCSPQRIAICCFPRPHRTEPGPSRRPRA